MSVEREHAQTVIEDDRVSVDAEVVGEHNDAVLRGNYRTQLERGEIESEMNLVVDDFAVVRIGAAIGEAAERRGVRLAAEGPSTTAPARRRGDLADRRLFCAPLG
jgi:hypothetical protein